MSALKDYPLAVLNESGETIPGFAVMQVSGWEPNRSGRDYIKVTKPDGAGEVFLLNSPFPIADDTPGLASDYSFLYALYDDGETPAVDEAWGPESGSWKLKKDNGGFFIVGDEKGSGANARVRVSTASSAPGSTLQWCEVTEEITAMTGWGTWGSGGVQIKDDAGVNDGSPIEVENRSFDVYPEFAVGIVDTSFDPPRVVVFYCTLNE